MAIENKLSEYNSKGEEIPDPRPTALQINFKAPPPLNDRIDQLVKNALIQRDLEAHGIETFAEADDFEMDDLDPSTPYEESFDPLHTTAREQEIRAGFVQEIPDDVKAKAKEVIEKHRKKPEAPKKPEASDSKEDK